MKKTIISLFFLSVSSIAFSAQADTATRVQGWDMALPNAERNVVSQIQTYAIENYYTDVDQGNCGGATAALELSNYYTHESFEGELIHKVKIKFLVKGSYRYCEGEVISECQVPMTLYSGDHVSMGRPTCTVVELP